MQRRSCRLAKYASTHRIFYKSYGSERRASQRTLRNITVIEYFIQVAHYLPPFYIAVPCYKALLLTTFFFEICEEDTVMGASGAAGK
jgi:hypothetical protein